MTTAARPGPIRWLTVTSSPFHAIVPAGGAGTRLWPLSRTSRPKFLLDLEQNGTGRTMIQQTWDRLVPLTGPANLHVVTGAKHAEPIAGQLPELTNLVVEPSPRDSMPAIGLATAIIAHRDPDATVGSFAADHVIHDVDGFHEAVREGIAVAQQGDLVTIGISPTSPSSAFGYINAADPLDGFAHARRVGQFVEKPDEQTAAGYLAAGTYSWNAGMFIARADSLLQSLATFAPQLHDGLREIAAVWDTDQRADVLESVWPGLTKIAIDHAIAEPLSLRGGVAVVPATFDWSDLGDFDALAELRGGHGDEAVLVDSASLVINTTDQTVSVVGLDDAVVVVTDGAVLVTTRTAAQQVKQVPAAWADRGHADLV